MFSGGAYDHATRGTSVLATEPCEGARQYVGREHMHTYTWGMVPTMH